MLIKPNLKPIPMRDLTLHTTQNRSGINSGVDGYGASNNFIFSSLCTYCVVCEISWHKCQQLTFDQYCSSHKTISHQAAAAPLKFAVSAP